MIIDDPIKNELFLQTKKMVSLSKVPTSKIVRESEGDKLGFYLFYNFGDSLYRGNFNETQNYIHDVDSNIILIRDSILPNIKFTRVKEIFKSYEDYYLSLRFELRTYPVTLDTAGLLEHHTEIVKGFVFNDYVYKPDTLLLSKRRAIVSKQLEIYDLSYRVTKLYELGAMIFLYPYYLYTLVIE
ncbi:hypothetical protein K1X84_06500 [bacterium]|nr:hypothetical protein [bacterium]